MPHFIFIWGLPHDNLPATLSAEVAQLRHGCLRHMRCSQWQTSSLTLAYTHAKRVMLMLASLKNLLMPLTVTGQS